jgi:hypothetical protein
VSGFQFWAIVFALAFVIWQVRRQHYAGWPALDHFREPDTVEEFARRRQILAPPQGDDDGC